MIMVMMLIFAVFVVGCVDQQEVEKTTDLGNGEVTEEELAELSGEEVIEFPVDEDTAIAGQAVGQRRVVCDDSMDNGKVYDVFGVTMANIVSGDETVLSTNSRNDFCRVDVLYEYYCEGNERTAERFTCSQGACVAGECKVCEDTDPTNDVKVKGVVSNSKSSSGNAVRPVQTTDKCARDYVVQYSCAADGKYITSFFRCRNGCTNGVCNPSVVVAGASTRSDRVPR